jgi:TonB family C-terminal domain
MFDPDSLQPKTDRLTFESGAMHDLQEFRQRRKTAAALVLLLLVLGLVLYRHRDFWFAEIQGSEQTASANSNVTREVAAKKRHETKSKSSRSASGKSMQNDLAAAGAPENIDAPPIQIEVIASNGHQILHPRNRSIELGMQGTPASHSSIYEALPMTGTAVEDAASVTSNAAQEVRVSVDSAEIIDSSAKLDYPLLARQMKIKGSVILEALIGRDGVIQDLDVVSGAPILADAAKAAVRQWHFKPHVRGDNTVEANAKIKVNFIISTF